MQYLLQLVLWNKLAHLKEQGHNGFPERDILQRFLESITDRL